VIRAELVKLVAAGTADEKLSVATFEDQETEEILNPELPVHPVVGYETRVPLTVHVADVDAPGVGSVVQVRLGPPVVIRVKTDVFVPDRRREPFDPRSWVGNVMVLVPEDAVTLS